MNAVIIWFICGCIAVSGYALALYVIIRTKTMVDRASEKAFLRAISRKGVDMKASRTALYKMHEDTMQLHVKGVIPVEAIPGIGPTIDNYLTRYDEYVCDTIAADPKRAAKILATTMPIFANCQKSLEEFNIGMLMNVMKTLKASGINIKADASKPDAAGEELKKMAGVKVDGVRAEAKK